MIFLAVPIFTGVAEVLKVSVLSLLLLSTLVLLSVCAALYYVARDRDKQLEDLKGLFSELQGVSGFDNIIKVIEKKLSQSMDVLDFFQRSKDGLHLQGRSAAVSLFAPSAPVNAFYNLKPSGLKRKVQTDSELAQFFGWNAAFIPIFMKGEGACWKSHGCNDEACRCYGKGYHDCWVRSGTRYRGKDLTHKQKAGNCLHCQSFLPVGVFVGRGGDLYKTHEYLERTFSAIIKGSVLFDRTLYSATRDGLTGLFNKPSLKTTLAEMISLSQRYSRPLSLCMFDIDHFKKFNDTYGHPTGDALLAELGGMLPDAVRRSDICTRYGGEEFVILFPETEKEGAFAISEKFREKVESHHFCDGRQPALAQVTISMGVATFPTDAYSGEELIERADQALYASKKTGRNRVTKYSHILAGAKV